jgi:acyl-CoA thioesterase I
MSPARAALRVRPLRAWLVAMLVSVLGCGSGRTGDSARDAAEAKNNMSAGKGEGGKVVAPEETVGKMTPDSVNAASSISVRTPVVLFFGTSLTAGAGLDPEQAFPSLVEKKARSEGLPIKSVNAGLSGETTAGAVRRIDWVLKTPADLVVIEGGANDALRGLAPEAARANIEHVIDVIRREQPRARIALIQMEAPPNYGIAYTRSFRAIYADIARKENIPLLPFLLGGVAGISRLNQADGVHPNTAGEQIVADNVWRALKPIVAQLDRGV